MFFFDFFKKDNLTKPVNMAGNFFRRNVIVLSITLATILTILIILISINTLGNPFTTIATRIGTTKSSISTLSVSDDGQLLGLTFNSGNLSRDYDTRLKIMNVVGEIIYETSLGHTEVNSKITFSPNLNYAVFVRTTYSEKNPVSVLHIVDLKNKELINLSDTHKLGDLAYAYSATNAPIWYDEDTLIYEHRIGNEREKLVFVNWKTGEEIHPHLEFSYNPALSHDKKILAYTTSNKITGGGIVDLMLKNMALTDDLPAKQSEIRLASFDNISNLSWSPDDKYLAFSYRDDESYREGISPIIVYDVNSSEPVYKMYEWLAEPQWAETSTIMTGYYEPNPFHGQRSGSFSKMVFFDINRKIMLPSYIKALRPNFVVIGNQCQTKEQDLAHDSNCSARVLTIQDDKLVSATIDRILDRKMIDNTRDQISAFWRKISLRLRGIPDSSVRKNPATSLEVSKWPAYYDQGHGIYFKHPIDWNIADASGLGYFNANLGKGTDGIDITLVGLQGDRFDQATFEKTIVAFAENNRGTSVQIGDFEKIMIGSNEFYRIKNAGVNLRGGLYNFTYYLNNPVPTWPWHSSILTFTVNSYAKSSVEPDPNGDYNPSVQVLKTLLSTIELKKKPVSVTAKSGKPITGVYQPTIKLPLGNIWGEGDVIYVDLMNRGSSWQVTVDNFPLRPIDDNGAHVALMLGHTLTLFDSNRQTRIIFTPYFDESGYILLTEVVEK